MNSIKILADKYVIFFEKGLGQVHYKVNQGSFGSVYKGCLKDNPKVKIAIKKIKKECLSTQKQKKIFESYQSEVINQQNINSKYVVKIIDVWEDEVAYYIVQEYCEQGNLATLLQKQENNRLPREEAFQYFQHIVQGYRDLYINNTIHRDLKPENILFKENTSKLADFGFSKKIEDMDRQYLQTNLGSPLYSSPEMLKGDGYSSNTDIWSLGCILFEMLYGVNAFNFTNTNILVLIEKQQKPIKFPKEPQLPPSIIDLIKVMLKYDPKERLSWDQLFIHPLIVEYNKEQLFNSQITNSSKIRNISLENEIHEVSKKIQQIINFEQDKRNFLLESIIQAILIQKQLQGQLKRNVFILCLAVLQELQISSENFKKLIDGKINGNFSAQQWELYKSSDKFCLNKNKFRSHQKIVDAYTNAYFPIIQSICDKLSDINLINKINEYKDYTQNDDPEIVKNTYIYLVRYYLIDLIKCYKKSTKEGENKQILEFIITIHQLLAMNTFTINNNVKAFKAQLQQTPTSELINKVEQINKSL